MIQKLKDLKIKAMKDRDSTAKGILSVLHSDSLANAKKDNREVTDQDIIKSAKSLIKKNEQVIADLIKRNATGPVAKLECELEILKEFLPKQMTENEIISEVDKILSDMPEEERIRKNQGTIMKELKKFGDSINMGIASKYVASMLK